ncbi:ArnT family glycosyltransferase [Arthrobacter sp. MA-N2]|uniref:ArnT family glycosyltransferase n=1 Tax=Arthrobacter sp. MA-N2 TaxID=1101188 RepID=UPI0018CC521C|nr:glycosyltransferase family 39 protein [Arthrobacter sp. MA-N2]
MAGSEDWTAFFYGSSDPGNAITVDKPPLSLWIMSLSVRIFGLSSWSILLPQALMGVLSVYLLYRMVAKRTDPATGLLAGLFFAVTPVATVMFRYNNPDALLTLLMIGAAYAALEAVDRGKLRWLLAAGACVGAGFLAKQLQILLILPALGVSYLAFSRLPIIRRLVHLCTAFLVAALTGGLWFVLVQLANPSSRPFIGGSRTNSVVELTVGYNGLDRLTGEAAVRTMSPETSDDLASGFQRFLQPQFSGQFGWYLPLALAGLCIVSWLLWKRAAGIQKRALLVLCAIWFVTSATVLAFMSGIVHPYYSLVAVPPLSCLAAFGLVHLLRLKTQWKPRLGLGVALLGCVIFAYVIAARSISDFPWFPQTLLILGSVSIAVLLIPAPGRRVQRISTAVLLPALLAGPLLWSISTVLSPHVGASVMAGPSILNTRTDSPDRRQLPGNMPPELWILSFGDTPGPGVVDRLRQAPTNVTWSAAMVGSESAANYQLASGRAVIPVGGFDGTDPSPTLEQFQELVGDGRIGSMVIQNLPPMTLEGRGEAARIIDWVRSHFRAESIDGVQYYSLRP